MKILLSVCIFSLFNLVGKANNVSWNNAVNGNWSDGTKWSGGVAPSVNDTAVISVNGTYTVTMDVNATVAKFILGGSTGTQTLDATNRIFTISNNSSVNSAGRLYMYSTTLNGSLTVVNSGEIVFNYSNTFNPAIDNFGTIRISHYNNLLNGSLSTHTGSLIISDGSSYTSNLTVANGFINNGTIELISLVGYSPQFTVTTGSITNAPGGVIISSGTGGGNRELYSAVDNQGTITVNYNLLFLRTSAVNTNSGSISIATSRSLTFGVSNTLNFIGGSISGFGQLIFTTNSIYNVGVANIPSVFTELNSGATLASASTITNNDTIHFVYNGIVTANLLNNGVMLISQYANTVSGTFSTTSTSQITFDAATYNCDLTFSNGFINNGTIDLRSLVGFTSTLNVTVGALVNAPGANIFSSGPSAGTRTINAQVNNQGNINVNFPLTISFAGAPHSNTGNIIISGANVLNYNSGTLNWAGGGITGSGKLVFNSAIVNFNVATIPAIAMEFNSSTLGSTFLPITNSHKLTFFYGNTISAAIFNTDTIAVSSYQNTMAGALTTSPSSVISLDAANFVSVFTVNSGFTNNGVIDLRSMTGYSSDLQVTSGTLINAPTGVIHSFTGIYQSSRTIEANIENQGNIIVDLALIISRVNALHKNSGSINIASGQTLTYQYGSFSWNGGIASGTGKLSFDNCIDSVNVSNMPNFYTIFNGTSKLASNLSLVNNSTTLQFMYNNTIQANLNNTSAGIINISYYGNIMAGQFTNEPGSMLSVDASGYVAEITFNNGFTNNGTIDLRSLSGYSSALNVTLGELLNSASGLIHSYTGPYQSARTLGANLNNQGTLTVDLSLSISKTNAVYTNTGNVNIASGQILTYQYGTLRWNGGTASGTGILDFDNCIDSVNVSNMPSVFTKFDNASKLSSNLLLVNNSTTLQFNYNNIIQANLNNKPSGIINFSVYANIVSGQFTNEPGSMLAVDAGVYISDVTFNNGFTNNGTIDLRSLSGYSSAMNVTAGELLNSTTGVIHSYTGLYQSARTLAANLNNQGTLTVDLSLLITKTNALHTNTGNVSIASGQTLTFQSGSLRWNGGALSGTGTLAFDNCIDSVNVANMPSIFTTFNNGSKLASNLSLVNNATTLQFIYNNIISANLNNAATGLIRFSEYSNFVTGIFSNVSNSNLKVDAALYISDVTFSTGFTNNGNIELGSITGYSSGMIITSGVLTNSATGLLSTTGIMSARNFSGQLSNNGIINIIIPLFCTSSSFINNSTGLIKGTGTLSIPGTKLENQGHISPGSSPGILSVGGNIHNTSSANLDLEIGGLTQGTQYDMLDNSVTAGTNDSLNGTLNINLINGYIPSLGDSFVVNKYVSRVGTFATVAGQAIPGGLFFNVFYRNGYVVLRAGNPPDLTITSSTGPNGNISPLGNTNIVYNGTQAYTMNPNPGYHIDSVIVDGAYAGNTGLYTFSNVEVDHSIRVVFALTTFPITASVTGSGVISPPGTTNVPQFTNQTYTITPSPCFVIDSVIADGNYTGNSGTYTFSNVTTSHTIRAVFRSGPRITANGSLIFCAGGNVILDAGSGYTSYSWSTSATTQTITASTSGTYACTITSTGGCSNTTSVVVTVNPLPSVSLSQIFPADNNHVCLTSGGINLTLSSFGQPAGGAYSGTGVVNGIYQNFIPSSAGMGTHLLTYTYNDGNGCSSSASDNVIVDQSAVVQAGANIILCNNLVAQLNGTANATANPVNWTSSGSGLFINANSLSTSYTLSSSDSSAGSVILTLHSSDPAGPCGIVTSQLTITYNPDAIPDAGPNVPVCSPKTVVLNGSITGFTANPHWTSTGTGTFANANSLSTTYIASASDSIAGKVKLILTPIDPLGNCTFGSDTLEAWFEPQYSVNAGSDILLCGINDTIAILNGSFTHASQVSWTTNGTGTFGNIHNTNSTYTLSAADRSSGYIILTLTTNDPVGPCNAVSGSVAIKYKYAIGQTGAPDICGDSITALGGSVTINGLAGSAINYSWTTAGSGTFSNSTFTSTNYTASNADLTNGSVKVYFTPVDGAAECIYVKDSSLIWFNPHYTINSGPDTVGICSNGILNLSGAKVNASTAIWSSSGTGVLANPNLLITTYTPSVADSLAGSVKIYLTSNDPPGPCGVVVDSMLVIIHPAPLASAGSNSPICLGTDLDLTASGGSSYSWTGPNGFTSGSQNIILTPATFDMAGTYHVIISNAFGCVNPASTVVVINPCTPGLTLILKVYLEGFYQTGGMMNTFVYNLWNDFAIGNNTDPNATDTIEVGLWSPDSLENSLPDYSERVILHKNGLAIINFPGAAFDYYYIAVKHRNSIETWSRDTVRFLSALTIYDFSAGQFQAYGDGVNPPMKNMGGGVYAIYSGDVDQNGTVDILDMAFTNNDANVFAFGYLVSDCNGDGAPDILDFSIMNNNANLFLFYARPY